MTQPLNTNTVWIPSTTHTLRNSLSHKNLLIGFVGFSVGLAIGTPFGAVIHNIMTSCIDQQYSSTPTGIGNHTFQLI
jgi:hypothetical protein